MWSQTHTHTYILVFLLCGVRTSFTQMWGPPPHPFPVVLHLRKKSCSITKKTISLQSTKIQNSFFCISFLVTSWSSVSSITHTHTHTHTFVNSPKGITNKSLFFVPPVLHFHTDRRTQWTCFCSAPIQKKKIQHIGMSLAATSTRDFSEILTSGSGLVRNKLLWVQWSLKFITISL